MEKSRFARRCCCCCCLIVVLLLIVFGILAIVLKVLLKPKDVSLSVNSLRLQQFDASLNIPTFQPTISLILDLDVQVFNPNRASFRFENSTVFMFYHGNESAHTFIPAGRIPARGSVNISTVLDVDASKVVTSSYFASDMANGTIPVTTQSSVKGRVNLWNIYKHKMVSISSCVVLLSVPNRTITSYVCENKRKF